MLGISDAAISFEEPRDSVLSSKYLGEKELKVLSCPAGHQSVGAMTIRELLSGSLFPLICHPVSMRLTNALKPSSSIFASVMLNTEAGLRLSFFKPGD